MLVSKPALCVGCRMCEMSCALEKSGMFNPVKARVWIHRNKKRLDTPMICRHCLKPPCDESCPVKGERPIRRDQESGIVRLHLQHCIGCYECVSACPFGAMRVDPHSGDVFKCDLCEGDPECAKWCPTGALQYVERKAMGTLSAQDKV